ncbi:MAG: hypothetical protein ABIO35_08190 [Nitrobacter sp.]
MTIRRDRVPAETRKAALGLLASGKVTLPELAEAMGVSTHMLWNWCRIAKVDWRKARHGVVAREMSRLHK